MRDIVTKIDSTSPPTGNLTAAEFNDHTVELENAVSNSGQVLNTSISRQLGQAISVGGNPLPKINNSTADIGDIVEADNALSPVLVNLTSTNLFVGAVVYFDPVEGQLYSTHSLTVGRNGNLIMGLGENMVVSKLASNNVRFKMTWKAGSVGWLVSKTESVGRLT